MSGMFGGGKGQSMTPQRYNGIQISSSVSGGCIPLIGGRQRAPFNCIWYGAFSSKPTQSQGGKGGSGSQTTGFNYKSSFAAAFCEGPIASIAQVWRDKDQTSLALQGLTLFTGTSGQTAWSYLTTNFPSQAIPYDHIAYVGAQGYALGNSAQMPNITAEIVAVTSLAGTAITFTAAPVAGATSATLVGTPLSNGQWNITFSDFEVRLATVNGSNVQWSGGLLNLNITTGPITTAALAGLALDADAAAWLTEYLTDPNHGAGLPSAQLGVLTGTNSYQSYCQAMGFSVSPMETTQRAAADYVTELLQVTNSAPVWSAGVLKVIPYADNPVTGNGVTYTPNITPQFSFGEGDFLEKPKLVRKAIASTYNHVRVEYCDRSNDYNTNIAEATDIGDISANGERVMSTLTFHQLCNSTAAGLAAQLILQANLYERNTATLKVRSDYSQLEPMDYVAVNDPVKADGSGLGWVNQLCRVQKVTDEANHRLTIEVMKMTGVSRTASVYNWASVQGYNANFAAAPGSVQAPAFMEAYGSLVSPNGGRQLWIAVGGPNNGTMWGGCTAWLSFDNVNYEQLATITAPARYGTILGSLANVADPDSASTLTAVLNNQQAVLGTGTTAQADQDQLLIAVGSGSTLEVLSYANAALVTAGEYNLTYLRRGQYLTQPQSHSTGAQFMRLDANVFRFDLDPGYLGVPMYFKFTSFNIYSRAEESLASATAYSYTPSVSVSAYNATSPSTILAAGACTVFGPTSAVKQTSAASAWDSCVYSGQSFSGGCSVQFYPSYPSTTTLLTRVMVGLTTNPANNLTGPTNYTNLAYAFYLNGANLQIYEAGSLVGTFATSYTTSTLLQILYDGKHVQYYIAGVLVRSVPIANQTFFMQSCFFDPGASVYGLSFNSSTQVATPFTLTPMSANVAVAGTTVKPNSQAATSAWGSRCFQSAESYNNGAQVSFSVTASTDALSLGFSTAPATGDTTGTLHFMAGWYARGGSTRCDILFNGANIGIFGSTPLATDVFSITYDNFTFRWWRNGALVHQEYFPNAGPLFLFGDFFDNSTAFPTEAFTNISFTPYGLVTPSIWIARGFAQVTDENVLKTGGAASTVDSDIYSINTYPTCHIVCKPNTLTGQTFVGLSQSIPGSPGSSQDFSLYLNAGTLILRESGTNVATIGAYAITDLLAITYDGSNIRYFQNDTVTAIRTVAIAGKTYFANIGLADNAPVAVNSLEFGPGQLIPLRDTTGLGLNAATTIVTASVTGATTSTGTANTITSVTVGPFPYATTVVVTATGYWSNGSTAANVLTYALNTTGGNFLGSTQIQIQPLSSTQQGVFATEQTYSLAANTTQTYYLTAEASGGITAFVNINQATIKAEAIKR
jgi:hypothetical protein